MRPHQLHHVTSRELRDQVLLYNGDETIRQAAKRLGVAPTTIWDTMRREGFKGRAVTRWERRRDAGE
jgi:hypothetical protein